MQANFEDPYFKAGPAEYVFPQRVWHTFDGNLQKRVYLLYKDNNLHALTLDVSELALGPSKYPQKLVRIPPLLESTAAEVAAVLSNYEVILNKDDIPFFAPVRGILKYPVFRKKIRSTTHYRDVFLLKHQYKLMWKFSFADHATDYKIFAHKWTLNKCALNYTDTDSENIYYDQRVNVFSNAVFFPSKKCSPEAVAFIEDLKNKTMVESADILAKTLSVVSIEQGNDIKTKIADRQQQIDKIYRNTRSSIFHIKDGRFVKGADGRFVINVSAQEAIAQKRKLLQIKIAKLQLKQKVTDAYGVYVQVEPLNFPSHIDARIRVSRFRWAVTLILHGGHLCNLTSQACNPSLHAQGIIEGVNDGYFPDREENAYFMHRVDFTGEKINFEEFLPSILAFKDRSQIWLVVAEKAKNMLNSIKDQIKHPPAFSKLGSDSFFSKSGEHNCFTWLREELAKADIIHLGKSKIGPLLTMPRYYTRPSSEYFCELPVQEL